MIGYILKIMRNQIICMVLFIVFNTANSYAQDWANLKRYQEENSTLIKDVRQKQRVVFMGNSITEGWSHHRPEFFRNDTFINRGISGQTTPSNASSLSPGCR